VKIKCEEQLVKKLVESDNFFNFQIFNTCFEFFDKLDLSEALANILKADRTLVGSSEFVLTEREAGKPRLA